MPQRKVTIDPDFASFIDREVRAGRFASGRDVVHFALARLQADRNLTSADEINELREQIDAAIREADAGEFVRFEAKDVFKAGRERSTRRSRQRKGA